LKKIKFRGFRFLVCGDNNLGQQDRILAHDYLVGGDTNQGQKHTIIWLAGTPTKDSFGIIFLWLAGTPTKDKTKDNFNTHKK